MMKKPTYNPYGFSDKARFVKAMRLFVWGGIALGIALHFLVYQPLFANSAPRWITKTVFYLSDGISTAALFATLALLVLTVSHEEGTLRKKLFIEESLALVLLSLVLRMLLDLGTAAIDHADFLGFYLNDVTLSSLLNDFGFGFWMRSLSALFGILTMLLVIGVSAILLYRRYQSCERGKTAESLKRLPTLVYLGVSLMFAVIETVMTIAELGFAFEFGVLFTLLLPYLEIAIYTLVGKYLIDEIVTRFETV